MASFYGQSSGLPSGCWSMDDWFHGLIPLFLGIGTSARRSRLMFRLVDMEPMVTHLLASMKFLPRNFEGSGANCPNPSSAFGLGNMLTLAEHDVG